MLLRDIAVIIGMPRTGTTWLYENLKNHPDICASDYKEINRYLLDVSDAQYCSYFCDCSKKVKLDVSPYYFFDREALIKIAVNHDKVILLVREPEEWIESLNRQVRKFDKSADDMANRKQYVFWAGERKLVFDYGEYRHVPYLCDIRHIFKDKLLVLEYSLLQNEPMALLKRIEVYLGIRNYFTPDNVFLGKINAGEQQMSRLYGLLVRRKIIHKLIPIAIRVLPKPLLHWLRRRFIYGDRGP